MALVLLRILNPLTLEQTLRLRLVSGPVDKNFFFFSFGIFPIASYQCCIIFRTGTYFPIQTTTRSKIGPGGRQGIKLILRYALTKSKF